MCQAYAEAVANEPDVAPNLCFPGKAEVAEMVAEISGKQIAIVEDLVAAVRCSKIEGKLQENKMYVKACPAKAVVFLTSGLCCWSDIPKIDCKRV